MIEHVPLIWIEFSLAAGMVTVIGWFLRLSYNGLRQGQTDLWMVLNKLKDEMKITNSRTGKIETWTGQHEKQDDERHGSIDQRLSRIEHQLDKQ